MGKGKGPFGVFYFVRWHDGVLFSSLLLFSCYRGTGVGFAFDAEATDARTHDQLTVSFALACSSSRLKPTHRHTPPPPPPLPCPPLPRPRNAGQAFFRALWPLDKIKAGSSHRVGFALEEALLGRDKGQGCGNNMMKGCTDGEKQCRLPQDFYS